MKIGIFLIGVAILVASAESPPFPRRSLSPDVLRFRNAIEERCLRDLDLTLEETATMEKVKQVHQSSGAPIQSQEDVDRLIDQEAPNRAVANSLKPKIASMVACTENEFNKMLGLRRRR